MDKFSWKCSDVDPRTARQRLSRVSGQTKGRTPNIAIVVVVAAVAPWSLCDALFVFDVHRGGVSI